MPSTGYLHVSVNRLYVPDRRMTSRVDELRLLQLLLNAASFITPILQQVTRLTYGSSTIGVIFVLLVITSVVETFLLALFRLARLSLIIVLMFMVGAAFIRWLLRDDPRQNGDYKKDVDREE